MPAGQGAHRRHRAQLVHFMFLLSRLKRIGFDAFILMLLATVGLATLLPAQGAAAEALSTITYFAVALLFLLYGIKLNTGAIIAGLTNWRLQALVLGSTFVIFPLLAFAVSQLLLPWLQPQLAFGILYLGLLPSTVQSSIAFTSIAGGNVPAAVCAASLSNLLGVFITPLLVALFLHTGTAGGFNFGAVLDIGIQILLPFVLGQLLRPLAGTFVQRHGRLTQIVDRGSILLIVYAAFSAGVVAGIWQQIDGVALAILIGASLAMLAVIMTVTLLVGWAMGMSEEDRLVLLFCGSKKSIATGLPMANILFGGQAISMIVLPAMIFHQIQLIVCAIIAQRRQQGVERYPLPSLDRDGGRR